MKAKHFIIMQMFLITAILFAGSSGIVLADESAPEFTSTSRVRVNIDNIRTEKMKVTIKAKETGRIRTGSKDFIVKDQTEILNKNRAHIRFADLKVPCVAIIQYEWSDSILKEHTAWRIIVKKVSPGATSDFSEPEGD